MIVFAQRGIGSSVIPEVIAAAGVSQGSFYNYFRTNDDLLAAVSEALSHDMVQMIEGVVAEVDDPALRVATAGRLYLHLVRAYPVVARFLSATGFSLVGKKSAIYEQLPADIKEGVKRGTFDADADVGLDLATGAALIGVQRIAHGRTAKDYPERIVRAVLKSLGVPASAAKLIAAPAEAGRATGILPQDGAAEARRPRRSRQLAIAHGAYGASLSVGQAYPGTA
jgi:AcrR family transcriptional regulator